MSLSCYIVDDEFHAIEVLRSYIQRTPGLTLAGWSERPAEALDEIGRISPGLLFLDIDMPVISGIELAVMAPAGLPVVFTTSFREYAPEAFELRALDYLLKPIAYARFLKCVAHIRQHAGGGQSIAAGRDHFWVKSGTKSRLEMIRLAEIIYICGALNYIEIFTTGARMITYLSMAEVLDQLPPEGFSRIHKSYIVNHGYLRTVDYSQVNLGNGTILPIGRAYRNDFNLKMAKNVLSGKKSSS